MQLINTHLCRQSGIISSQLVANQKIHIIGAGAVGGWTALSLAKMGFLDIHVWDMDVVSEENMAYQFYPFVSIGSKKVEALAKQLLAYTKTQITTHGRYTGEKLSGIVISALDNMETRRMILESNYENQEIDFLIDPRMGGEYCSIHTADWENNDSVDAYKKSLYSDAEAVQERCTEKGTMYTCGLLSGFVCKIVKDMVHKQPRIKTLQFDIASNSIQIYKE